MLKNLENIKCQKNKEKQEKKFNNRKSKKKKIINRVEWIGFKLKLKNRNHFSNYRVQ